MNNLERLKEEARENLADFMGDLGIASKPTEIFQANRVLGARIEELITHVYTQAIEDAKSSVPREDKKQPELGAPLDDYVRAGWNSCRTEALTALTSLVDEGI